MAALQIIVSKGTAMDVNDLIDIARTHYGEERKLALQGIRALAAETVETARALIASEMDAIRRIAVSLVEHIDDAEALLFLEGLLSHEGEDLRIAAVGQIRKKVDHERLADLLHKYTGLERYFYNVVTWFDRLLYAPAPISMYYEAELDRKLEALGLLGAGPAQANFS
jgi:hypothetical protein